MRRLLVLFNIFVISTLLGLIVLSNLMWWFLYHKSQKSPSQLIEKLLQLNQNLLDRLMSQDLQAYTTMTALRQTNSNSETPYYSQHDQAVVERLRNFASNQGLGDEIYYADEELTGMLQDFGYKVPGPEDRKSTRLNSSH